MCNKCFHDSTRCNVRRHPLYMQLELCTYMMYIMRIWLQVCLTEWYPTLVLLTKHFRIAIIHCVVELLPVRCTLYRAMLSLFISSCQVSDHVCESMRLESTNSATVHFKLFFCFIYKAIIIQGRRGKSQPPRDE